MAEQTATATADDLKNCGVSKKPVKRAKRYYRNGKYFCTKNCWRKGQKKTPEA